MFQMLLVTYCNLFFLRFFYKQKPPHHSQPFVGHSRPEFDQAHGFRSLSRSLPSDVEMELDGVLNSLTGTKESIKGANTWFMQRSPFVPALAEALRDRVFSLHDSERQLHMVYLANDILFDRRMILFKDQMNFCQRIS